MRRGEVWWAHLPEPIKPRPVLLLSRDAAYERRARVTVGPITTTIRSIDSEVRLGPEDGLRQRCVVNLDDIQTIPKAALTRQLTMLSRQKMDAVNAAIRYALDIEP